MNVAESATVSRVFEASDVADIVDLCGLTPTPKVPEPLIAAMWSALLGCQLPGPGTLYLQQDTRYLEPAELGERLTATVEVVRLQPERHLVELETRCTGPRGELLADGTALVYVRYLGTAE